MPYHDNPVPGRKKTGIKMSRKRKGMKVGVLKPRHPKSSTPARAAGNSY